MKIAFLFGSMDRGGAERVIASLANTFCAQGDEIAIITIDSATSGYKLDERVQHIRLNLAGQSKNKIEGLVRNLRIMWNMRKLIKKEHYDVVVTFFLREVVRLQYAFPFGRKFKLITSDRANPKFRKLSRFMKWQYDTILPKVDGFIFQTERVSMYYPERLRNIGTVIHNGVFPEILPQEVPEFIKRRHKDICAVGRLEQQKGYDILLEAFSQFQQNHSDYHLHIFGEGGQRKTIEEQIMQLGLADCVTLYGSVPDVMFQVADMGMFVLPSRFEGMPNALMEAMACGLPCIAADCDFGPGELIRDHENGILVPVEDAEKLAAAMAEVADNQELAEKLSRNGQEIRRTHDGNKIASKYRQYIENVVNGKH